MKKLLGAVLALAMLYWCPIASADLLKNFKANGGIDVQADSVDNLTDLFNSGVPGKDLTQDAVADPTNDYIGQANTRLWVGAAMDPADDVHAKVTLVKTGRAYGVPSATAGQQGEDVDEVTAAVQVLEANVKLDKLMNHFDMTLGRQFYGSAGDPVVYFGPSMTAHWLLPVTAVDVARVDCSENEWVTCTGIAGKLASEAVNALTPGADTDLRGIDLGWKLPVEGLSANTYWYNRVDHVAGAAGVAPANEYLNNFGLKAKWMGSGLSVGGNLAFNNGQDRIAFTGATPGNFTGFAHWWDAGYKHEMMGTWNFGGHFAWGQGDDATTPNDEAFTPIASDYRPGDIWGRFPSALGGNVINSAGGVSAADEVNAGGIPTDGVNAVGLTNRVIWSLGIDYTPEAWEKLTAGIHFYNFSTQRKPFIGTTEVSKKLGSELDLRLGWKHSDNVWLGAGVAKFSPGGWFSQAGAVPATIRGGFNQITLYHADFKVMF